MKELTESYFEQPMDKLKKALIRIPSYDALVNEENEVLFAIPGKIEGYPERPVVFYDGGPHAFLLKNKSALVLCSFIPAPVRTALMSGQKIYIYEKDNPVEMQAQYLADLSYDALVRSTADSILNADKDSAPAT